MLSTQPNPPPPRYTLYNILYITPVHIYSHRGGGGGEVNQGYWGASSQEGSKIPTWLTVQYISSLKTLSNTSKDDIQGLASL